MLLLVCLALFLRLFWIAVFARGVDAEPPGALHLILARNLLQEGFASVFAPISDRVPPFYPVVVAGASLLTEAFTSLVETARLVSAVLGSLLVVPTYLIASVVYNRSAALVAACAVATHPLLVKTSSTALPDSTFLTVLLATTYFVFGLVRHRGRGPALMAGVLFGLTLLTSPAGALCLASSLLLGAFASRRSLRETTRQLAVVVLFAAVVCGPYVAAAVRAGRIPFDTALVTAGLNLKELPESLSALGLVAWPILIVLAAIGLWSSRTGTAVQLILVSVLIGGAMGTSSVPAIGLLPILLIWASHGVITLSMALRARFGARQRQLGLVQVIAAVVIISTIGVPSYRRLTEAGPSSWMLWDAGWWIGEVQPAEKQVMDASPTIPFHASARHVPFPEGDERAALDFIDEAGIDFVVVRSLREPGPSYIGEWLRSGVPDRRARLVYARQDGDGAPLAVYKWVRDRDAFQRDQAVKDANRYGRPAETPRRVATAASNGPLRRSAVNPRYFTDESGRAIYLTGAHTWGTLQDGGRVEPLEHFDFGQYLAFVESYRLNFIRLWAFEQSDWVPWRPYHFRLAPVQYARIGPGLALDQKPQFDLTTFDETYFRRLRERVASAQARNIYVSVMLFQGWSVETKSQWENPWNGHPYHRENNVNGIDGDPRRVGDGRFIHTLGDKSILSLQERYVEKVVDTLNDLDNVLFEICNECDGSSLEWQSHMVRWIHLLESKRPKRHPVGITALAGGHNIDLFRSPADWISPGIEDADGYDRDPPASDGSKVVITDTDHIFGIGGDRGWVWKSFLRGLNPIFMDPYDRSWHIESGAFPPGETGEARWDDTRRSMGQTADFASRVDLASMLPRSDLSSSGFCLARPGGSQPDYLIYNPTYGPVSIDLRGSPQEMAVEWFDPTTGDRRMGRKVMGGVVITFAPPFAGDAVLRISASDGARRQ